MTVKELAEVAGVSNENVRKVGKRLFPGMSQNGIKTIYTENQSLCIMREVRKKNLVSVPTQSVGVPTQSVKANDIDNAFKLAIVTLTDLYKKQDERISNIEKAIETRKALLPPPKMSTRSHITKLVREYATKNDVSYRDAWINLYMDYGYRTNTNPTKCAKNREMSTIDYLDAEGQIEVLESVAMEMAK